MLHRQVTDALLLKIIKYDDTSVIVNAYTRSFGVVAFIAKGVRKQKSKIPMALLQPMNLLQIVCGFSKKGTMGILLDASLDPAYITIPYNLKKNAIMMFINEVLYKSLKEEQPNEALFEYLKDFFIQLDQQQEHFTNCHLFFLAKLTEFYGICPNFEKKGWFDFKEGTAVPFRPLHDYAVNSEKTELFKLIFSTPQEEYYNIQITTDQRNTLLDMLLIYYALHIPGMDSLCSRNILHDILHS